MSHEASLLVATARRISPLDVLSRSRKTEDLDAVIERAVDRENGFYGVGGFIFFFSSQTRQKVPRLSHRQQMSCCARLKR